jgi:hypothetical protein
MNEDIDEASAALRPFEPLSFAVRTDEEEKAGVIKEAQGHAALQSALAVHGLPAMTPERAKTILLQFGVEGEQARQILIELWQHAYKKLLFRDDHVDRGEQDYLARLQAALGLSRAEIRCARSEIPDVERGPSP